MNSEEEHTVLARPIGVSLFRSLFSKYRCEEALTPQGLYNELYCAVAEDEEWLFDTLRGTMIVDPFAATL